MILYLAFYGFLYFLILSAMSIILWWGIMLFCSIVFLMLIKRHWRRYTMLYYYLVQEVSGYLFLARLKWEEGQTCFIFTKIGLSPFHFWVFTVCSEIPGELLAWFLTIQKLPYIAVASGMINPQIAMVPLLGVALCSLQAIYHKRFRQLIILGRTESIGWNMYWVCSEGGEANLVYVGYTIFRWMVVGGLTEKAEFESPEVFLWFTNAPGTFGMYAKLYYIASMIEVWRGLLLALTVTMRLMVWAYLYLVTKISSWSKAHAGALALAVLFMNVCCLAV